MRVLICGGRHYQHYRAIVCELDALHASRKISTLISGGCAGADQYAAEWAARLGIPTEIYKADWYTYERAAGPIRNQKMLDEGKPDLVVAFPGGKGTADMVRRAVQAGVEVVKLPST